MLEFPPLAAIFLYIYKIWRQEVLSHAENMIQFSLMMSVNLKASSVWPGPRPKINVTLAKTVYL